MSLTTPSITNCSLKMSIHPSTVNLINDIIPICLNVYFNSITDLEVVSGSYSPNNDTKTIATGITNSPNFIILVTDNPLNLTVKSGATVLTLQNPVSKLYFNVMVANSTYNITDIIIDGTTTALVPMVQASPVTYSLIYGVGAIN